MYQAFTTRQILRYTRHTICEDDIEEPSEEPSTSFEVKEISLLFNVSRLLATTYILLLLHFQLSSIAAVESTFSIQTVLRTKVHQRACVQEEIGMIEDLA